MPSHMIQKHRHALNTCHNSTHTMPRPTLTVIFGWVPLQIPMCQMKNEEIVA